MYLGCGPAGGMCRSDMYRLKRVADRIDPLGYFPFEPGTWVTSFNMVNI